ncbi:arylphorin subunit alpha-like isoform X3 [Cotesia glomerata]|uniref:arylphorin subunit alpha-like isoform X3 n=1 Tax=Cotesia glomerata TaxID=32391 RepID=UPI001D019541|nr:arylphorin subunit alpha-like isoform X3 [Cotesia glomerata]
MASTGCSTFSPDNQLWANCGRDGKLKIWETRTGKLKQDYVPNLHLSSGCSVLEWITVSQQSNTPSPWMKRKRKSMSIVEDSEQRQLIAMGTVDGKVIIYNPSAGSPEKILENGHSAAVTAITWSSVGLFTAGDDDLIVEWNLQGGGVKSTWKSGQNGINSLVVSADGQYLVAGERLIRCWSLETKKVVGTFTGHANPVIFLRSVQVGSNNYVISGANGDSYLCIWSLSESAMKAKTSIATLTMQDDPVSVSVKLNNQSQIVILATNRTGQCHLFVYQPNGLSTKPLKPTVTVIITTESADKDVTPVAILSSQLTEDNKMLLAYGTLVSLAFDRIVPDLSEKIQMVVRKNVKWTQEKKTEALSKVKNVVTDGDVKYVAPGAPLALKRSRGSTGSQLPLQDRLEHLSLNNEGNLSKTPTKGNNKTQLLLQGLTSRDRNILNSVLLMRDEQVITNTVVNLPVQALKPLIGELVGMLQGKTFPSKIAVLWIKTLIITHAAHLLSLPNIDDLLSPVLGFIEDKLTILPELSRLRGRVALPIGLLPRDVVYSPFHPAHYEETVALFRILYFAKDYDTFYKTAIWARSNVNVGLFGHTLAILAIHRPDTVHLRLPPLYEIIPHAFFNSDVMQAIRSVKIGDAGTKKSLAINYHEGGDIVIPANYSGWYLHHENADEELTYFTEDIGLCTSYFFFVNDFPHFMNSEVYQHLQKEIRGEKYFFGYKQLLARYYLERLSNNMGEIEFIDWHEPILTGFYPTLTHTNGLPFPHRNAWSHIPNHKLDLVHNAEEAETRILATIDSGIVYDYHHPPRAVNIYTPEGLNILGNLVDGNADSLNREFYGSLDHLSRMILGFGPKPIDKNHLVPSTLEYYTTSIRDPAFFRIYKKIVGYYLKYKEHLPQYTHEDLAFPGVKIDSVVVDKLFTFFEPYDVLVSNGVLVSSQKDAESTVIKVRQQRLNHEPFTYHINVSSKKKVKANVRVFLGPKFDHHGHELEFTDNWAKFIEMEQWIVDLKPGTNKIERSSHESIYVYPDEASSSEYWKLLTKAIETDEPFTYNMQVAGFPDRLILPRGKREGLPLKLFVFVSEFDESHSFKFDSPVWGQTVTDAKPLGYPLDRPVVPYAFTVPNAYFKDVTVYHKPIEELN